VENEARGGLIPAIDSHRRVKPRDPRHGGAFRNALRSQGIVLSSPKVREIQYATLPAYAAESGRSDDEYQSDKEWATEIITQAKELAVCYERLTGSAMENFGFLNEEADRFVGHFA
jgi:hypothetical protein